MFFAQCKDNNETRPLFQEKRYDKKENGDISEHRNT